MSGATEETPVDLTGGDDGALSSHSDAVKAERRRYQNKRNQRTWRK